MATVAKMTVAQIQAEMGLLNEEVPYLTEQVNGGRLTERLEADFRDKLVEKVAYLDRLATAYQRVMTNDLPNLEVEIADA